MRAHEETGDWSDEDDANWACEVPSAPEIRRPMRLEIGRLVEGRLRILRVLGRGGMSEVYEAFDERTRTTRAIKLMLTEQCRDAQLGIFAEARALVRFRHPHVVGFHGVGVVESQPFIELECAPGGSLAARVESQGPLDIGLALAWMSSVAGAVGALHDAGIVHRDIKADNVLLTDQGRPVVADFGLAMTSDDMPTLPSGIIGTPAYMAPEAILGITEHFEQYAAADQYSLAVTTYFALTGTLPFDAPTPNALFYAQMAVAPDPPSTRRRELPPRLDEIVVKGLAKRPADRFASAREFGLALGAARHELGLLETDTARPEARPRPLAAPVLKPTVVAA